MAVVVMFVGFLVLIATMLVFLNRVSWYTSRLGEWTPEGAMGIILLGMLVIFLEAGLIAILVYILT